MPFDTLRKNIKTHFKNIISQCNYGDNVRLPFVYLKTYSRESSAYYEFPYKIKAEPFESYQSFPKLSEEVLVALFASIGVHWVPEITVCELDEKTPLKSFQDFCMTFGEENGLIDIIRLNTIIERLKVMDSYRKQRAFDSRPIYKALSHQNFKEADRLIDEMKEAYSRDMAVSNLKKDR